MKLFELFAEISLKDNGVASGLKAATAKAEEFGEAVNDAGAKIDNLSKKVENGLKKNSGSTTSGFDVATAKAIALGNAIYNAGVKVAQFALNIGKSAIEAAATIEAEEAQFNAAFASMAGEAAEALQRVQDSTGILSSRLSVVATKAFSQLKGAGLGAADSLEATEKYMNLAADAAAYYDISLEDADARLRSFMRGNTEAGDAIGLFTSEAQRNERAMEKYGKKWTALTEAQKQMLMLDIAGNIYQQSGAIGQAARESDSWANIMGNLKRATTEVLGALGAGPKEGITPIIQQVIDWMNGEETQTKAEQLGIVIGNSFLKLTEEGGAFDNVKSFISDISEMLAGTNGKSVLTSIGAVVGVAYGLSHPIQAAIAGVALLVLNWETVKKKATEAYDIIKNFTSDKPTAEETGSATIADIVESIGKTGNLDTLTAGQRAEIYADPVLGPMFDSGVYGPEYHPTENEEDVSYRDILGYARGLPYVPYDNYLARLHRGEQVLTAREANEYRSGSDGGNVSALYSAIVAAVREGVSNIGVNMDGRRVGELVADSVSRAQAQKTANELRARGYNLA